MKKRSVDYFSRQKAFIEMSHTPDVKSLLIAEFNASRNIVVKKDILKTIEAMEQMGHPVNGTPAKQPAEPPQ